MAFFPADDATARRIAQDRLNREIQRTRMEAQRSAQSAGNIGATVGGAIGTATGIPGGTAMGAGAGKIVGSAIGAAAQGRPEEALPQATQGAATTLSGAADGDHLSRLSKLLGGGGG